MKLFRSKRGMMPVQPFFSDREIEETCTAELKKVGLLPDTPEPVRIDRFIEKRFGKAHEYSDMKPGILGYTAFGPSGVEAVYISRSLEEDDGLVSQRRVRTTLAHEAGHGLFHAFLFVTGKNASRSLFDDDHDDTPQILCRDVDDRATRSTGYDGRWWEFQANKAMGALLLPAVLVHKAVAPFLELQGHLGGGVLPAEKRTQVISHLSQAFNVNPKVAELRLKHLYPASSSGQMAL